MFINELNLIFASSITLIVVGLFYLYYKNRDHKDFLYGALFFLCCAMALYGEYHLRFNAGSNQAIFWSKILYIALYGFIYTFPVFLLILVGIEISNTSKKILGTLALISFAFIGLTTLIITDQTALYSGVLQAKKGILYPVFIALILIIPGGYYVRAVLMATSAWKKTRFEPLIISVALALICASIDVAGVLLKKPLIPWCSSTYTIGLFLVAVSFAWVFLRQYSWVFDNLTRTRMELEKLTAKSDRDFVEFIQLIAKTLDAKDHYTAGHSLRVMDYAVRIANTLNLSEREIELLKQACLLHDIGKISIPDGILNKKKPLTKEEREYIMKHPEIGKKILSTVGEFKDILDIIYSHHERIDGKGYPQGIIREYIPLLARILAVADTYDAMRSERPYRKAKTKVTAIIELNKVKGSQLDEEIVDKFIECILE